MGTASALQHRTIDPNLPIDRGLRLAALRHGKSFLAQLREIWRLQRGPGKLRPAEYYYYRLYDDTKLSLVDKQQFIGQGLWQGIYRTCNPIEWWGFAHDKLTFYAFLQGFGLPHPITRAVVHPFRRALGLPLRTPADLAGYLRRASSYPFFGKPVTGIRSVGVMAARAWDAAQDAIVLDDGTAVAVDEFVQELEPYWQDGYLFQERLAPHSEVGRLCGGRLSTVRLIITVEPAGASLHCALWKIPVGANPADNFWRPGNLLAALDPNDGRVTRIIQGVGWDQVEVERHPDTSERLLDTILPDWPALTALGSEAARTVPRLRLQAWDIALTDRGPTLVEVNIGGDFNLPQLAHGRGMMDERFRAFVERCKQNG